MNKKIDPEEASSGNAETFTSRPPHDGGLERQPAAQNQPGDGNPAFPGVSKYEFINSQELARRWDVPVSWVRDQVRSRAPDPLPHVHLGKYVRFIWGSPQLEEWIVRRIVVVNNRRMGRVQ
jgi:hypothetical protein